MTKRLYVCDKVTWRRMDNCWEDNEEEEEEEEVVEGVEGDGEREGEIIDDLSPLSISLVWLKLEWVRDEDEAEEEEDEEEDVGEGKGKVDRGDDDVIRCDDVNAVISIWSGSRSGLLILGWKVEEGWDENADCWWSFSSKELRRCEQQRDEEEELSRGEWQQQEEEHPRKQSVINDIIEERQVWRSEGSAWRR